MATKVVDRVFVDTNVLVYANLTASHLNPPAVAILQSLHARGVELWVSRQILREYLASMTRPVGLTGLLPMTSLIADVRTFEAQYRVAEDGPIVTAQLLQLLARIPSLGKQIHDANIIATMLAHGIPNLLTHNVTDFVRFAGVINVLPLVPPTPPAPPAVPVATPPPPSPPPPPPPGAP